MPGPFTTPHAPVALPALYLYPLNDSFVPKHISLVNQQRVKIGRQTNAKTVPAERNGFFDSKVLSRQHAEVWEENGKIFIKDVKSSNGTFINGDRLSQEGLESEPFELKTDDIVEFGIDIVGEDNRTIIHHKVAARVFCVFTEQDAQAAARAEAQQSPTGHVSSAGSAASGSGTGFNFANGQQPGVGGVAGQRRPTLQAQSLTSLGSMGQNVRAPGRSGLTFDHILSRLQGELQKSRDTGAELHATTGSLNEIHDTLGGNLPPNLPSYPQTLPSVMPPAAPQQPEPEPHPAPAESASVLAELQAQLRETQLSLASHVEKIRALEGLLAEHDAIKREVSSMRELMEERKRDMEILRRHSGSPAAMPPPSREDFDPHSEELHDSFISDDDDARSVATVVPHELERVDEEDEEQLAAEAEEEDQRRQRRDELERERPKTPEPTGIGMSEDDDEHEAESAEEAHGQQGTMSHLRPRSPSPPPYGSAVAPQPSSVTDSVRDDLHERLTMLSQQLESALELSRSLDSERTSAQSTIASLEAKVSALETLVQSTQVQVQTQAEAAQHAVEVAEAAREAAQHARGATTTEQAHAKERESLTEMLNEWKKAVEGRWSGVQEEWSEERERLRRAKEEWEARVRVVEESFGRAVSKVESGLSTLSTLQAAQQHQPNGNAKIHGGGLVTPPSPRSLSADSTRPRQRKKRSSSSRGRSRTRSRSPGPPPEKHDAGHEGNGSSASYAGSHVERRVPWAADGSDDSDFETHSAGALPPKSDSPESRAAHASAFPTPEPSVLNQPLSHRETPAAAVASQAADPVKDMPQVNHVSTAVGVVVLSMIAAAVIWRVKPDGPV
ncbi:hypothetical protein CERSUDRAFT_144523 [Gelatoporia subvermispora B]|uniref:FHA domain-containing protein n=1 Tax=Ceriporiopsis subvermispora (strain B) TaxID=914234 RepID=M2P999_CERS8|nr:hypothetical protein CERSUDRAFT_144523 [Gelatoporia subvermispora B]